jgi:hypothetical protein
MDGTDALVTTMEEEPQELKRHPVGATIAFFSEAIRFIVIPLVILYILIDMLARGQYALMLTGEEINGVASDAIIFGLLVAVFAAMEAYYPKCSRARMACGILAVGTLCAWFWFVLSGQTINLSLNEWNISIDIRGLLVMMMFVIALKAIVPVAQYLAAKGRMSQVTPVAAAPAAVGSAEVSRPKIHRQVQEEPPPPDDFVVTCPKCKRGIPASANVCPHCKTWIRQTKEM